MTRASTPKEFEQSIKELRRKTGEQKQAGGAIREAEEKYRTLFDESNDAIYITSCEGRFLDVNRALLDLFGYSREEMIDRLDVREIYAYPGQRDAFQREIEKKGSVRDYEVTFKKKNGTEMACTLSSTVRRSAEGDIIGYQGIIRDVTEQKRIERLRDDVHRMMRHDLKSPLIGIVGFAGLLLKGENLTGKQLDQIRMIRQLGERMIGFIDRTRDLFQMEEGIYQLHPQEVNLLSVLKRIEQALNPLSIIKKANVAVSLFGRCTDRETEYVIPGEEALVETMFANLMKNAIEAAPEGSDINISIDVEGEPGNAFHVIDIHNMGVIPLDIRERFFEPYTTHGKKGGTGLGAHNALLVARAHKGDITFTTSEQEGTHVTVRLPEKLA